MSPVEPIEVEPPITLNQFIKLAGLAATGGEAKLAIAAGQVRVNGLTEARRGRQLETGDVVETPSGIARVARQAADPGASGRD